MMKSVIQSMKDWLWVLLVFIAIFILGAKLWERHRRQELTAKLNQVCTETVTSQWFVGVEPDREAISEAVCRCSIGLAVASPDGPQTASIEESYSSLSEKDREELTDLVSGKDASESLKSLSFKRYQDSCLSQIAPGYSKQIYANAYPSFIAQKASTLMSRNRLISQLPLEAEGKKLIAECLVEKAAGTCKDQSFYGLRKCTGENLDKPFWEDPSAIDSCQRRITNENSSRALSAFWKTQVEEAMLVRIRQTLEKEFPGTKARVPASSMCLVRLALEACQEPTVEGLWNCLSPEKNRTLLTQFREECQNDANTQAGVSRALKILK